MDDNGYDIADYQAIAISKVMEGHGPTHHGA